MYNHDTPFDSSLLDLISDALPDSTPLLIGRSANADDALLQPEATRREATRWPTLNPVPRPSPRPRTERTASTPTDAPLTDLLAPLIDARLTHLRGGLETQLRRTVRDALAQQIPTLRREVIDELRQLIATVVIEERLRRHREQRGWNITALAALLIAIGVAAWVGTGSAGWH